jgi:hypothetical protein
VHRGAEYKADASPGREQSIRRREIMPRLRELNPEQKKAIALGVAL